MMNTSVGVQKRVWILLLLFFLIMSLVVLCSTAESPFPHAADDQGLTVDMWEATKEENSPSSRIFNTGDERFMRGIGRLGSKPPSCEHKCRGCVPCEAIQVPTNTDSLRTQFANYEPEGWKCKCDSIFYNP